MNKPLLEEYRNGYHLAVYRDLDPESPAAWDGDSICGWIRHFNVKNSRVNRDVFGALIRAEGLNEYRSEAQRLKAEYHVFPLDAYVHSGVILSLPGEHFKCSWDTSALAGCVIVPRREQKTRQQAEKIARAILTEWNQYLAGDVFGYTVSKQSHCGQCGQTQSVENVAAWGIYGNAENALAAAREAADALE